MIRKVECLRLQLRVLLLRILGFKSIYGSPLKLLVRGNPSVRSSKPVPLISFSNRKNGSSNFQFRREIGITLRPLSRITNP